jgi:four helix bundle protein
MTYQRFEDLPVWQEAIRLAEAIYGLTQHPSFRSNRSLQDQIERAAVSVSNNIAEGFERGTTNELLAFLYIARGSAGEVRSMLCLLERLKPFVDLKSEISNLKLIAESCSRQVRAWADSLQNSDIKGQRHLNEKVRVRDEEKKRSEAFQKQLLEVLPKNHPLRIVKEARMSVV